MLVLAAPFPISVLGDAILLSGDEQTGGDRVMLSGDEQSGDDVLRQSSAPLGDGVQTFRFEEVVGTFTGIAQGVAFDGTHYYTTAVLVDNDHDQQWVLEKRDASFDLVDSRDTELDGAGSHNQIAGIYYDDSTDKLYVAANNFFFGQVVGQQGWVHEYNASDLSFVTYHDTGANICEQVWPWGGYWWQVNANAHEILQFDLSWNLVDTHALPGADPTTSYWQAIFVINDIFYLNLHNEAAGANPHARLRAYEWNGSGFDAVAGTIDPPTWWCGQGAYFDGANVYWAERVGLIADHYATVVKSYLAKG